MSEIEREPGRVALDVESTLAAVKDPIYEQGDIPSELSQIWGFDTEEQYDEFMRVSDQIWREQYESIGATEEPEFLSEMVSNLGIIATVDIVTSRLGVDDQVKEWLELHDIEYTDVVFTPDSKAEFEYETYIDDKPALVDDVLERDDSSWVYVIAQPYNPFSKDSYEHDESVYQDSPRVRRVEYVSEAARDIIGRAPSTNE